MGVPGMKVIKTRLPGVLILEPEIFRDERGLLLEVYRESWREQAGLADAFVQENQSRSHRGVVRGLHYQLVNPQGKLVRTSRGRVFDVVVDVRRGSPHFGQWLGVELDDESHCQLWIPPGFAHGFCALSEEADVVYRCTQYYHAASNRGVAWDDPAIGIAWPETGPRRLSAKDRLLPALAAMPPDDLPEYEG
jgi:dTDP-4-dehydrorhamnose 3,5-epimerase